MRHGIYRGLAMTVAGSDSGGGAGIQADLKTFASLKVFGTSAITAVTVQNSVGVTGIHPVPPEIIKAQILAVGRDFPLDAVKTGMLGSRGAISAVAEGLAELGIKKLVVDPVMVAQSGDSLLEADAVDAVKNIIVPMAMIVTPNLPEAEKLTGMTVRTVEEMKAAAEEIAKLGCGAVLVKGGHLGGEPDVITDVLYADGKMTLFEDKRIDTTANHGTGCTPQLRDSRGARRCVRPRRGGAPRAVLPARGGCTTASRAGHGAGCLGHAVTMPWTEIING